MAQQTAVEWLWRWQMDNEFASFKEGVDAYKKAKAMEKEQIMEAFYKGRQEEQYKNLFINHERKSEEQYYNETYNK